MHALLSLSRCRVVEELLDITHLALVSYRLPDTGEIIPPAADRSVQDNEERLLLVSPELASVLATIVTRLRQPNDGTIPAAKRYDVHERTTGPNLPHLFQRRVGWRSEVIAMQTVQKLLTLTLNRAGLVNAANQPLHYTPYDFRLFATEAVTGGLPIHIAARLLGHHSLTTTQAYVAVFQDDLVRTYRAFLDRRRAVRPQVEYREPTEGEWREFQQHFEVRKLELGTCGRPYGIPCKHEHGHPMPQPASGPTSPTTPRRDRPQPPRPHHRSTRQRMARRSPGASRSASMQPRPNSPALRAAKQPPQSPH